MISSIVVVIGVEICDDIGIEFIEEVNIVVLTVLDDNDVVSGQMPLTHKFRQHPFQHKLLSQLES